MPIADEAGKKTLVVALGGRGSGGGRMGFYCVGSWDQPVWKADKRLLGKRLAERGGKFGIRPAFQYPARGMVLGNLFIQVVI